MLHEKYIPTFTGDWNTCVKCNINRPPGTHHCRRCGQCVRKMDHHCPWLDHLHWISYMVMNFKYEACCQMVLSSIIYFTFSHHCSYYFKSRFKNSCRINNCVGEDNQWLFMLLLFYTYVLSIFTLVLDICFLFDFIPCKNCSEVQIHRIQIVCSKSTKNILQI